VIYLKVRAVLLLLVILGALHASAETFWDGLVSYEPPLPMWGSTEPGDAGLPVSGYEFRYEGSTNGYAQVTFQISSIMMLYNHGFPTNEVKTIFDLKKAIDKELQGDRRTTNYETSIIKFADRDAVIRTFQTTGGGSTKWIYGVTFFWHTNLAWIGSSIFSIYASAEKRETFDRLVASLRSVKIRSTPPAVKLAKDGMQLGFTQDDARKLSGEPIIVAGPNEYYITEKYLIYIDYPGPENRHIGMISYSKIRDAQKAAASMIAVSNGELPMNSFTTQTLPMTKVEAENILQTKTSGGKFTWSSAGDDEWKRSDGAMAKFTSEGLTIATAGVWPNLRFQK
jgi:hypothetical protein